MSNQIFAGVFFFQNKIIPRIENLKKIKKRFFFTWIIWWLLLSVWVIVLFRWCFFMLTCRCGRAARLFASSTSANAWRSLVSNHGMIVVLKLVILTVCCGARTASATRWRASHRCRFFRRRLNAIFLIDQIAAQVTRALAFLKHVVWI